MGKETKDTRDKEEASGGEGGDDSLKKAAENTSKTNDISLASLFVEANSLAETRNTHFEKELFLEEEQVYENIEHSPDPVFLQEIYDSLANKEIHHKKLLEEGESANFFVRVFKKIASLFNFQFTQKQFSTLSPIEWKTFEFFHNFWKKNLLFYWGDFNSFVDLWLRNKQKTKQLFVLEAIILGLVLLLSIPPFFLFYNSSAAGFGKLFSKFIFSISSIAITFSLIPPFFFTSLWFSNVNYLHTSKNFHIFLFFVFTVSFMFAALSSFSAAVYYLGDWKFNFSSTS